MQMLINIPPIDIHELVEILYTNYIDLHNYSMYFSQASPHISA